jgi:hypothetical protein
MSYSRPHMLFGLTLMVAGALLLGQQGCGAREPLAQHAKEGGAERRPEREPAEKPKEAGDATTGKSLFDGKTLAGWKAPDFGGDGKVYVDDGAIVIEKGAPMTGIAWTGKVVHNDYELSLEGKRMDGSDFFCTTTFPVGKDSCSLVVGGWGGGVVGLSNVDFHDASSNPTMKIMSFKEGQWYRVRIRVSDAVITAWIDEQQVVNQSRKGHRFGIRSECDLCRPLGICTYGTKGAVRNIRLRLLESEKKPAGGKK